MQRDHEKWENKKKKERKPNTIAWPFQFFKIQTKLPRSRNFENENSKNRRTESRTLILGEIFWEQILMALLRRWKKNRFFHTSPYIYRKYTILISVHMKNARNSKTLATWRNNNLQLSHVYVYLGIDWISLSYTLNHNRVIYDAYPLDVAFG